ncbi:ribosome assembly cofactor RimP [Rhodococcus sp. RS1C4]|nr:ribosome assembly cofactor RimP [Rhodococcus sp. RS1C4]OZC54164.1 ribosome assembly cofactor RimP [Rhodococcus sp. 06-621-2]OZD05739.1 ribosome assembly cofactor RimP [Rhodococcus sp. 06-156-4C]OZD16853.1 ribosome assembly cofactor RimP [Rhodococcus sp. 06-156-4a]OZD26711.1 ribosome assembly cofactor RimP [Rhodococcus sp. 06-156-3C]OZD32108.1 ribosome assembly cofactor RimP [Rhodococcus sp. 06-156-3b]OZD35406.1 ribosome assembly cofactor RimP [Rhodococcus sp. 06-156-3]OZD68369.1 ribosome 
MHTTMPVPSKERVVELLSDLIDAHGFDLEDVTVVAAGKHSAVRIMVDREQGIDLDTLPSLSREISDVFDGVSDFGEAPYTLEVTTPGIDRPLTLERHWRRARGRAVRIELPDEKFDARIGALDTGVVTVVTKTKGVLSTRRVALTDVVKAVVQVEFSRPKPEEMELAGGVVDGRPAPADAENTVNVEEPEEGSDK